MDDIISRLREGAKQRRAIRDMIDPQMAVPHTDLMDRAADEIDRLRLLLASAEQRASEAESAARLLLLENLRGVFSAPQ